MSAGPRVPLSVTNPLAESGSEIQVNFCRMPDCDNYSVPARTDPVKTGPSPDRDLHYKVATTNKGRVSALVCKCCGEKPVLSPIKGSPKNWPELVTHWVLIAAGLARIVKITEKARMITPTCTTNAGHTSVLIARCAVVKPAVHAF